MRKTIIAVVMFAFLFVTLLSAAPAFGEDAVPVITKQYPDMSSPMSAKLVDPDGVNWDLTRGDLTVSYTMDMSKYTPLAEKFSEASEVGVWGGYGARMGWMTSGAPGAYKNDPATYDLNDMFYLEWPFGGAESNYGAYITSGVIGDWANMQLGRPWYTSQNYGFYFDRDAATSATNWGLIDGKNVNTGGVYNVVLTYHAVNSGTGVMFATVNGVMQGFYNTKPGAPQTVPPQFMPVGKLFNMAQNWAQVFVSLKDDPNDPNDAVKITNLKATGTPRVPAVYGVDPPSAEQGDVLDARVNGESFRDNVGISVNFLKAAADGTDTTEMFAANPVNYLLNSLGHTVLAHIAVPDKATPGPWNVTYKHADDPAVARLNGAFNVYAAPPKITSISVDHARRGKTITMNINGKFFRKPAAGLTVQLKRYYGGLVNSPPEIINASTVTWKSSTLITATFTIPSTATIGADWSVFVQHNDDMKSATRPFCFSVDAKMGMSPSIIWQHAPFPLSVRIYSETGFDATTINPNSVSMGGIIPYWYQYKDMNYDGKKDIEVRFWNSFVTIPIGFCSTVAIAARTTSWVPIKAYTYVACYWFLF